MYLISMRQKTEVHLKNIIHFVGRDKAQPFPAFSKAPATFLMQAYNMLF